MKLSAKIAVTAVVLAAAPMAAMAPTAARAADVDVTVNPGAVAFGYDDGYWDRDHHWHAWRNRRDAEWYHSHYAHHYYNHRHDRDRDDGWRRNDEWWEHH